MTPLLTKRTHTGVLVKDLSVEFGASGRMVHTVTVPKGTACAKLDGVSTRWVVDDLDFIQDKKGFLYSDADIYGIEVPSAHIVYITESDSQTAVSGRPKLSDIPVTAGNVPELVSANLTESQAFVLVHPEMGVYLGSCMGLGFWSKLDPAGQSCAPTFASKLEAEDYMATWDGGRPDGIDFALVTPDDGTYASIAACSAAGLPSWSDQLLSEQPRN